MKVVSRVWLIYRIIAHNILVIRESFAYEVPELNEFFLDSISVVVKGSKGCYRLWCVVIVREIL
jgi:hypothetical protein